MQLNSTRQQKHKLIPLASWNGFEYLNRQERGSQKVMIYFIDGCIIQSKAQHQLARKFFVFLNPSITVTLNCACKFYFVFRPLGRGSKEIHMLNAIANWLSNMILLTWFNVNREVLQGNTGFGKPILYML